MSTTFISTPVYISKIYAFCNSHQTYTVIYINVHYFCKSPQHSLNNNIMYLPVMNFDTNGTPWYDWTVFSLASVKLPAGMYKQLSLRDQMQGYTIILELQSDWLSWKQEYNILLWILSLQEPRKRYMSLDPFPSRSGGRDYRSVPGNAYGCLNIMWYLWLFMLPCIISCCGFCIGI